MSDINHLGPRYPPNRLSRANRVAIRAPMPREAPVTIATLPLSEDMIHLQRDPSRRTTKAHRRGPRE